MGDHADHSYVSTDNWPGGRVEAINVDPGVSRRIWIGVNCGALQLFSSSDCGESWVECGQVEGGLYRLTTADYRVERLPVPSDAEVFDLACGLDRATGKPVLYITTPTAWENGVFVPGVYRSADLGDTWEPLATGLDMDLRRAQTRRLTCIATCPTDASRVYDFKWAKQPILDPYNEGMLYVTTFGSGVWYGPAHGVEGA